MPQLADYNIQQSGKLVDDELAGNGQAYFVTVVDGPRFGVLSGPYASFIGATGAIPAVRKLAEENDPWAAFYGFGVMRMKDTARPVFGFVPSTRPDVEL